MKRQYLLSLICLLTTISVSAYDFCVDGIYYDKNGSEATVTSPNTYYGDITIPETVTYEGTTYSVTSISSLAFRGCPELTSVTIPNSVSSIGENPFANSPKLKAFYGKYASEDYRCLIYNGSLISFAPADLNSYVIPNSITSLGKGCFSSCRNLNSVIIPESVTEIGISAFSYCEGLTSITIPESVTVIGRSAFYYCEGLTSITIPRSVTEIGELVFYKCLNLKSVTIPNSVTEIGPTAFWDCISLTSVTIPISVNKIAGYAFSGCRGLASITLKNDNPANIHLQNVIFENVPTSSCVLYVPKGSKELYAAAAQWKDFANIEEINEISLIDGTPYTSDIDSECATITYTRTFNNTEWQPLYVPFNMSYDEWSQYADVAELYNVRGYDDNGDGVIDDMVIEFNKLTSGEIVPNVPYVIKAKETGTFTFECAGKNVLAAPEEEGTIECSSTKMTYSFHGVYQPKTDMFSSGAYHLSGGEFHQASSDAAVLNPNRFYLMLTPKTGGYNPSAKPNKIKMVVNGEESTGIEGVEMEAETNDIYYDLTGRPIANPNRGIYIHNGKKIFIH